MKHTRRIISMLLAVLLAAGAGVSASAVDVGEVRTVIGADLGEAEIKSVYDIFDVRRGAVPEITVTNQEEREYLEGIVDETQIGTKSISCVYIETTKPGKGIRVETTNITYCTSQMYISALATAGITDADIVVAAPWEVSGTAALTGVYKAYEDITGETLDETAKAVGSQELAITAELAKQLGEYDSVKIVNALKLILDETVNMTDEELRAQIIEIGEEFGVELSENQITQLMQLCRAMEKLDAGELLAKVQAVQETLRQVASFKDRIVDTFHSVVEAVESFFERVIGFFHRD